MRGAAAVPVCAQRPALPAAATVHTSDTRRHQETPALNTTAVSPSEAAWHPGETNAGEVSLGYPNSPKPRPGDINAQGFVLAPGKDDRASGCSDGVGTLRDPFVFSLCSRCSHALSCQGTLPPSGAPGFVSPTILLRRLLDFSLPHPDFPTPLQQHQGTLPEPSYELRCLTVSFKACCCHRSTSP